MLSVATTATRNVTGSARRSPPRARNCGISRVPVSWSTMPTTKNSAALNAAWLSRCAVPAKRPSSDARPYRLISRPSCDTVEYASRALRSVWRRASHDPQNSVARPSGTSSPDHRALLPKISPNLATSTTPALTMVAECRNAEMGVGASMAVGSHR